MKKLILPVAFLGLVIIVAVIAVIMFNQNDSTKNNSAGLISEYAASEDVAGLSITDAADKSLKLFDLNKTTLLTFWSSGCTECKQSLTDFQDFKAAHPEFDVTLVSFRDTPEVATAKLKEYGINFPTYYDRNAELFNALSASIPSSYLIKNNRIIYFFPGRIGTDFLDQLLSEFK